jgi:hypothetical protein
LSGSSTPLRWTSPQRTRCSGICVSPLAQFTPKLFEGDVSEGPGPISTDFLL